MRVGACLGGDAGVGGRSLADAPGNGDLPVPARHQHRHPHPRGGDRARRCAGPAIRPGKPPGRQRQHRRRDGGEGRAGRLHVRGCDARSDRRQQVHVQDHELRLRARVRAGGAAGFLAAHHRRQPEDAGGESQGACGLRQEPSGQAQCRHGRSWIASAHHARADQQARRNFDRSCAVSHRHAGAARSDLGRPPGRLQLHPDLRAGRTGGHDPRAGGDQPAALGRSAQCSDG